MLLGNDIYRHKLINYFENVFAKNEAAGKSGAGSAFYNKG